MDGPAGSAWLRSPRSMAVDPSSGNVYFTEAFKIRMVNVTSQTVITVAGVNSSGYVDGPASSSAFNQPYGIVYRPSDGSIFVADRSESILRGQKFDCRIVGGNNYLCYSCFFPCSQNHVIRMISGASVSTLAGSGGSSGYVNGPIGTSRLNQPVGLALHPNGEGR